MSGRVWRFGDDVNTDVLAPGVYMKSPMAELASHCLETVDETFAASVRPGDYVVAGINFGMGSSREQAVEVLKVLGVAAVIAPSFGGIFYRNAFNLGLAAIVSGAVDQISADDQIDVDLKAGMINNQTTGETLTGEAIPDHLLALVDAGGLVPFLEIKLKTN